MSVFCTTHTQLDVFVFCVLIDFFRYSWSKNCGIDVQHSAQKCKIIFDEVTTVTKLFVKGEFDVVPDVSDAVVKLKNLEELTLREVKLKVVW